ncbi:hypothetical protein SISSUDRAFT_1008775, partial [Sistotremastrum suecicum HHB10207 ss-3]
MSAKDRAEARKKALLSRGGDRLKKLTSSARGEDAPQFSHDDDPPLPSLRAFVGEETPVPTPPLSSNRTPTGFDAAPGAAMGNAWSPEQQAQAEQMMRSIFGGSMPFPGAGAGVNPGLPPPANPFLLPNEGDGSEQIPPMPMGANPLQSLMSAFGGEGQFPSGPQVSPPKPRTLLEKLLPLIHLVSTLALLAYFIFVQEPKSRAFGDPQSVWARWGYLSRHSPTEKAFTSPVNFAPLFWAFTTLEIVLHSTRIFTAPAPVQLPTLVSIALPHLPPKFQSYIVHFYNYSRMLSAVLDDLTTLLFGLGFFIWISSLVT